MKRVSIILILVTLNTTGQSIFDWLFCCRNSGKLWAGKTKACGMRKPEFYFYCLSKSNWD